MTAGANRVQLNGGGGEPMMSQSFWPWVSFFSANATARIEFNTNGLLLSRRNIDRLFEHRVGLICVSLDAATPETYAKIRGGDWDRVMQNLAMLSKARSENRRDDVRLALNMTVMRENAHEMPMLIDLAQSLSFDEVQFYKLNSGPAYNWTERTKSGFVFDYQEQLPERHVSYVQPFISRAIELGRAKSIDIDLDVRLSGACGGDASEDFKEELPQYRECTAPWSWLSIARNGNVYPCGMASAPIGSLQDQSLLEIWNGEIMHRLRGNIEKNQIDHVCKGGACIYVYRPPLPTPEVAAPLPTPEAAKMPIQLTLAMRLRRAIVSRLPMPVREVLRLARAQVRRATTPNISTDRTLPP